MVFSKIKLLFLSKMLYGSTLRRLIYIIANLYLKNILGENKMTQDYKSETAKKVMDSVGIKDNANASGLSRDYSTVGNSSSVESLRKSHDDMEKKIIDELNKDQNQYVRKLSNLGYKVGLFNTQDSLNSKFEDSKKTYDEFGNKINGLEIKLDKINTLKRNLTDEYNKVENDVDILEGRCSILQQEYSKIENTDLSQMNLAEITKINSEKRNLKADLYSEGQKLTTADSTLTALEIKLDIHERQAAIASIELMDLRNSRNSFLKSHSQLEAYISTQESAVGYVEVKIFEAKASEESVKLDGLTTILEENQIERGRTILASKANHSGPYNPKEDTLLNELNSRMNSHLTESLDRRKRRRYGTSASVTPIKAAVGDDSTE